MGAEGAQTYPARLAPTKAGSQSLCSQRPAAASFPIHALPLHSRLAHSFFCQADGFFSSIEQDSENRDTLRDAQALGCELSVTTVQANVSAYSTEAPHNREKAVITAIVSGV